ncbi:MAG: hypothetical protein ACFFAE_05650 [Candidatus Hodarchaeota archaeon]
MVINYHVHDAIAYYPETKTTSSGPSPTSSTFASWYLIATTILVVTALRLKKKSKES